MMFNLAALGGAAALFLAPTDAYSVSNNEVLSRRSLGAQALRNLAAGTVVAKTLSAPEAALAAGDEVDVYFGVGCFWHIQHEFVAAERKLLNRGDSQLTSRTGYAGGTKTGSEGQVCYHNFQRLADYGGMGHGEVVGMTLPSSKVADFADVYFSLYNPKTKGKILSNCNARYSS